MSRRVPYPSTGVFRDATPYRIGPVMKKEIRVAKEVAEDEFNRFLDVMEIDADSSNMNDEDRQSFEQQKSRVVNAIMYGDMVINESGEPVYTPSRSENKDAITFHEPTGASLMAMDMKKKTQDVSKMFATMADFTATPVKVFAKMKIKDLNVCLAVTTLFLG